tara:strand:+ start:1160 stop:1429 length:270 start_codon:yes stop_codon:yes gene_type:complete
METTFTVKLEAAASAAAVKAALECKALQPMAYAAEAGAADGAAFKAAYPGDLSRSARMAVAKEALHARKGAEFIAHAEQYLNAFCRASL